MKHQSEARQKQGKMKTQNVKSDHMKVCLTLSEVQTAVSQYKHKKSPWPDGVTKEILTHLGSSAIWKLLEIY